MQISMLIEIFWLDSIASHRPLEQPALRLLERSDARACEAVEKLRNLTDENSS